MKPRSGMQCHNITRRQNGIQESPHQLVFYQRKTFVQHRVFEHRDQMNLISVSATRTHTHELERLYHFVDYCLAKKDSHFFVLLQIKIILAQHLWKCCIGVNPTKDIINRWNSYSCNFCNLPQKKTLCCIFRGTELRQVCSSQNYFHGH